MHVLVNLSIFCSLISFSHPGSVCDLGEWGVYKVVVNALPSGDWLRFGRWRIGGTFVSARLGGIWTIWWNFSALLALKLFILLYIFFSALCCDVLTCYYCYYYVLLVYYIDATNE